MFTYSDLKNLPQLSECWFRLGWAVSRVGLLCQTEHCDFGWRNYSPCESPESILRVVPSGGQQSHLFHTFSSKRLAMGKKAHTWKERLSDPCILNKPRRWYLPPQMIFVAKLMSGRDSHSPPLEPTPLFPFLKVGCFPGRDLWVCWRPKMWAIGPSGYTCSVL